MKKSLFVFLSFIVLATAGAVAQTKVASPKASIPVSKNHPLGAVVRPLAAATTGPNAQIDFNWTNGTNAGVPTCTTTLVNCYQGDTLTDTTAGVVVAGPAALSPSVQSNTYIPAGGLYFGTHSFSIVANWFDGAGTAQVTTPSTVTVTNNLTGLNGPTGLTGAAMATP